METSYSLNQAQPVVSPDGLPDWPTTRPGQPIPHNATVGLWDVYTPVPPSIKFDYSVYLVTDSTPAILGDRNLVEIVEQAIQGGVTCVQYRDKHADTATLIRTAKQIHEVTRKYSVPLFINDRVDVAKAVGAEGVHLGQDDTDYKTARHILGPEQRIGISVNNIEEAKKAIEDGANYLGIGAVFGTPTKADTKSILGPLGVREILLAVSNANISTVAIGGINISNASRVLYQCAADSLLSGLAVVSAIIASRDPKSTAFTLSSIVHSAPTYRMHHPSALSLLAPQAASTSITATSLLENIPRLLSHHRSLAPLSHNMTNTVVQNFSANVCLAISASPIMSINGTESEDLSRLRGGLLVNIGTITPELMNNYIMGTTAYNAAGNPIVLDPVGAGATSVRRSAVKQLLQTSYFTLIKGNESEIQTVHDSSVVFPNNEDINPLSTSTSSSQKGVDSTPTTTSPHQKANLVLALSRRLHSLVLLTGPTDYLSDGNIVLEIRNGHPLLGRITGSGCALGSVLAAFLASARDLIEKQEQERRKGSVSGARSGIARTSMQGEQGREGRMSYLSAALAAVLIYEVAAELAVSDADGQGRAKVTGPGSFIPAFIDTLDALMNTDPREGNNFLERAKVKVFEF